MRYVFLVALFVGCGRSVPTTVDLIDRTEKSVVVVKALNNTSQGIGSGFIVATDRIVTNYHVVSEALFVTVHFKDGGHSSVDGVVYANRERDIAILAVTTGSRQSLKCAIESPRKGEKVISFGSPQGLDFTASDGIVSATREIDGVPLVQTSAPISQGNSGGPLVNEFGDVVGVNTFYLSTGQNLNFAVAASEIRDSVNRMLIEPQSLPINTPKRPEATAEQMAIINSAIEQTKSKLARIQADKLAIESLRTQIKSFQINLDELAAAESSKFLLIKINDLNRLIDSPLVFPGISRQDCIEISALPQFSLSEYRISDLSIPALTASEIEERNRRESQRQFEVARNLAEDALRAEAKQRSEEADKASKAAAAREYKESVAAQADAKLAESNAKKAASRLVNAKSLLKKGDKIGAEKWLRLILKEQPAAAEAVEAAELLKSL